MVEDSKGRWERARRWGRRITWTLALILAVGLTPYTLMCVSHALVDSEVGVMLYGMPVMVGLLVGLPILALPATVWGVGLAKARRRGDLIAWREAWSFLVIAGGAAFLLAQLAHVYWRHFKRLF